MDVFRPKATQVSGALGFIQPVAFLISLLFAVNPAWADNALDVSEYLKEFHENPQKVMNDRLPKLDASGNTIEIQARVETHEDRYQVRNEICARSKFGCLSKAQPQKSRSDRWAGIYAGVTNEDQIERFFPETEILRHLRTMEERGLTEAAVPVAPWSDSYWPTKHGGLGQRYTDPMFPNGGWDTNFAYFTSKPPQSVLMTELSPSEKYDVLVGDTEFSLTHANWQRGAEVFKEKGQVPGWYGLCHGWGPASFVEKEAKRSVTVRAKNGEEITFHPSDIHALAISLWANALKKQQYVLIGKKCGHPDPQRDDVGRVQDPTCFTTNPGSWHMAIVNKVGVAGQSFIMDATYDVEVWNQPVYSYKYSYFNPSTQETSTQLLGSVIPMEQFRTDKFKKYRSPDAKFVVGVAMDVTYVDEIQPSTKPRNGKTSLKTVRYIYDLELDQEYGIIGGEWYTNRHPDFFWAPREGERPVSQGEVDLALPPEIVWDGKTELPPQYIEAAKISSKNSQPVSGIVRTLLELAQEEQQ